MDGGTRINEEYGKLYFTILDFRNATDNFADPAFDGEPIRIKPVAEETDLTNIITEEETSGNIIDTETGEEIKLEKPVIRYPENNNNEWIVSEPSQKVYVNGVDVSILINKP